jgi:hypothetical protein
MPEKMKTDKTTTGLPYTPATPKSETDRGLEALVKRAMTDAAFRATAIANPAAAFAEVNGKPLPDGFVLHLADNARAHLSMVLPDVNETKQKPATVRANFTPSEEWTEKEAEMAAEALVGRAAADPKFRSLALSDPAAAINEITGKTLPAGFTLRFVDNAGATRTIILPDIMEARTELTEAELAAVAGGQSKWGKIVSGVVNWGSKVVGTVVSVATAGTGTIAGVAISAGGTAASSGCHYF